MFIFSVFRAGISQYSYHHPVIMTLSEMADSSTPAGPDFLLQDCLGYEHGKLDGKCVLIWPKIWRALREEDSPAASVGRQVLTKMIHNFQPRPPTPSTHQQIPRSPALCSGRESLVFRHFSRYFTTGIGREFFRHVRAANVAHSENSPRRFRGLCQSIAEWSAAFIGPYGCAVHLDRDAQCAGEDDDAAGDVAVAFQTVFRRERLRYPAPDGEKRRW